MSNDCNGHFLKFLKDAKNCGICGYGTVMLCFVCKVLFFYSSEICVQKQTVVLFSDLLQSV